MGSARLSRVSPWRLVFHLTTARAALWPLCFSCLRPWIMTPNYLPLNSVMLEQSGTKARLSWWGWEVGGIMVDLQMHTPVYNSFLWVVTAPPLPQLHPSRSSLPHSHGGIIRTRKLKFPSAGIQSCERFSLRSECTYSSSCFTCCREFGLFDFYPPGVFVFLLFFSLSFHSLSNIMFLDPRSDFYLSFTLFMTHTRSSDVAYDLYQPTNNMGFVRLAAVVRSSWYNTVQYNFFGPLGKFLWQQYEDGETSNVTEIWYFWDFFFFLKKKKVSCCRLFSLSL